jgi:hypothetical protein
MSWTLPELAVLTGAVALAALVGYRVGLRRVRRRRLRSIRVGPSRGPSISVEHLG